MIKPQILGLVLLCTLGCAGLPRWDRSGLSRVPSETKPSPTNSKVLADPSDQELAIAWETAQLAEQRGMDREAIEAYLEVRKHDPTKPDVAHALAVLYDRSGMTDAASREYKTALQQRPNNPDLHCDYGYFLYSTGDYSGAEASLREALRLQPDHTQATINLAVVIGAHGRYDEAQALFTEAIGPAAAMHNIGMLRLRAGEVEAAKSLLAEASRRDPSIDVGQPVLDRLAASPQFATAPEGSSFAVPPAGNPIR
ncbi:lipoprotein NlpI [Rosistilla oblonga]|uniref:tetratricopeptide repeat protein n=1 Tax=Rosistilla oblonga TaxID=2527990 RepID=UPI00118C5F27|nr:tetratricopeptide repeat protein [Rosistilla oblonga]QDV12619.1 lipoprotein NlpI [Rosistilla oblonga]